MFDENYGDKGGNESLIPGTDIPRLRPVPLGPRAIGFFDDELDNVIEALRRMRDARPKMAPKPAIDLALRRRSSKGSKSTRKSTVDKIRQPETETMSRGPELRKIQIPSVGTTFKRDAG